MFWGKEGERGLRLRRDSEARGGLGRTGARAGAGPRVNSLVR